MKIIYIFVFLTFNLFAQNWLQINLPFYGKVTDVSTPSNNKNLIFACGDDGIYKSTNAGLTWFQVNTSVGYTSIQVSSLNNNYIITDRDYSTDGGNNWFQRNNNYKRLILAEQSNTTLFQLDSYSQPNSEDVLKSTDFGQSWFKILPSRPNHREYSKVLTHSANRNLLYVISSDTLYKSTDLGSTWLKYKYRNSIDDEYVDACLDYRNPNIIYITFKDSIYKSTNGGINFSKLYNNSSPFNTDEISQIFSDPRESQIFYIINSNNLFKSTDSGASWSFKYQIQSKICSFLGTTDDNIVLGITNAGILKSPDYCESLISTGYKKSEFDSWTDNFISINNNTFYLLSKGMLYKTYESGSLWSFIGYFYYTKGFAISPLDANIIFVDKNKSTDGGKTWMEMNIPTSLNIIYSIYTSRLDMNYIFLKGIHGNLAKSTTNGESWEMINSPKEAKELYLSNVNKNNLYFISAESTPLLYKSTNLGETWSQINIALGNDDKIKSLTISDFSNDLFLAANSIFHSTDEGQNWNKVYNFSSSINYRIEKIFINPSLQIFSSNAVLNSSLIGSFNMGMSWSKSNRGLQNNWLDFVFINPSGKMFCFSNDTLFSSYPIIEDPSIITFTNPIGGETWTVGTQQNIQWQTGNIYRLKLELSTDGGNQWSLPIAYSSEENFAWTIPNYQSNNCLLKITSEDGIFGLSNSFKIKSTTNVEQHNNEIPSEFLLFQNYPNPFNPSTKIKYSIPSSENVEIKIFDVLGNEIIYLVNDYKSAGTYEIEFYANNLSSGIYFYRIISGKYLEINKMLLLR